MKLGCIDNSSSETRRTIHLINKQFIFNAEALNPWMHSHAMLPTPVKLNDEIIRIYTTFCDAKGIGRPGYVDVLENNPSHIIGYTQQPLFEIGLPGHFDDNGIAVCSVISLADGRAFMYYVGFELYQKVRYKLFTGLAIQNSSNTEFHKFSSTPILDRTPYESCFRCGPFCMYDEGRFKLWYVAGSDWVSVDGVDKPIYIIKYMESLDGYNWPDEGTTCINIENDSEHGFGRPYVIKRKENYHMFYSIRNAENGYRLGYAVSLDGKQWMRRDHLLGFKPSATGWDSEMLCYTAVYQAKHKTYLFYNGNDFGRTGFGYAELEWNDE